MKEGQNKLLLRHLRKSVAEFISEGRKKSGLTLEAASKQLGYSTVKELRDYECGTEAIPMSELHRILEIYQQPVEDLMNLSVNIKKSLDESN